MLIKKTWGLLTRINDENLAERQVCNDLMWASLRFGWWNDNKKIKANIESIFYYVDHYNFGDNDRSKWLDHSPFRIRIRINKAINAHADMIMLSVSTSTMWLRNSNRSGLRVAMVMLSKTLDLRDNVTCQVFPFLRSSNKDHGRQGCTGQPFLLLGKAGRCWRIFFHKHLLL